MRRWAGLLIPFVLISACSRPAEPPELAWDGEGDVRVHLGVTNVSDSRPAADLDIRLMDQSVVDGTFIGDPGNPHPPVHRYDFTADTAADALAVLEDGRVAATADLGAAEELWVDVAYYGPGRVEVTVFDEPVQYG